MKVAISTGLGALALLTSQAMAADLPLRAAPPPPPPPPVFTWTGTYFGVNAGYAFDHEGRFTTTANTAVNTGLIFGDRPGQISSSSDGFTGGVQVGYNYEVGGFGTGGFGAGGYGAAGSGIVLGIEADASYTDLDHKRNYLGNNNYTSTFESGLGYLGTVRGRVGYAFGQFLIYGTGGYAFGNNINKVAFRDQAGVTSFYGSEDKTENGYAYGGGVEYALPTSSFLNVFRSSAVTVKAEYLHYDLGRDTIQLNHTAAGLGSYTAHVTNDGDLARVGLNYKFGS